MRTDYFTDNELKLWFYEELDLRKKLAQHGGGIAFENDCTESMLVYSMKDLRRLSKIFEVPLLIQDNTVSGGYTASFKYSGITVRTYPTLYDIVEV